ncbi:DUF397 domain-containing protein [Streptomyces sp. NPDC006193]|uniref:DUF397 domain-containing protein n=1 Tax=Streptomyces sp. NPDC006193 TaxID=3155717 RepID=UPI0033BED2E4
MNTTGPWKKSSFSGGGEGNDCVEVAQLGTRIGIRDSKVPARGALTFPVSAFGAFLRAVKESRSPR